MVANHARKNAARQAQRGRNHRQAVEAVRETHPTTTAAAHRLLFALDRLGMQEFGAQFADQDPGTFLLRCAPAEAWLLRDLGLKAKAIPEPVDLAFVVTTADAVRLAEAAEACPPGAAAAGAGHSHMASDTGLLEGMLPYVGGWGIDYDLGVAFLGACWAACTSCRMRQTRKVVGHRATLAGLAGTPWMYAGMEAPVPDSISPSTRAWIERARGTWWGAGSEGIEEAERLLLEVADMTSAEAADLLEAALPYWCTESMAGAGLIARRLT
ncbi:hypothetical protein [Streptomyces yangpuensis]|uniref:hypothetical protein n=1 Tax=Streptomyces yangpuensis TaxID=1648182 RepID=UPI00365B16D9